MTFQEAKKIAKRFVDNDILVLDLCRELLQANTDGYKECSQDFNDVYDRITAREVKDDKKRNVHVPVDR